MRPTIATARAAARALVHGAPIDGPELDTIRAYVAAQLARRPVSGARVSPGRYCARARSFYAQR